MPDGDATGVPGSSVIPPAAEIIRRMDVCERELKALRALLRLARDAEREAAREAQVPAPR